MKNFPNFFEKKINFILCNFLVRTLQCKKKLFIFIFCPWKILKNHQKKLLRICPDPFSPQSSPGISPQPKIDFPYWEISGPDICSLICGLNWTFFTIQIQIPIQNEDNGKHRKGTHSTKVGTDKLAQNASKNFSPKVSDFLKKLCVPSPCQY